MAKLPPFPPGVPLVRVECEAATSLRYLTLWLQKRHGSLRIGTALHADGRPLALADFQGEQPPPLMRWDLYPIALAETIEGVGAELYTPLAVTPVGADAPTATYTAIRYTALELTPGPPPRCALTIWAGLAAGVSKYLHRVLDSLLAKRHADNLTYALAGEPPAGDRKGYDRLLALLRSVGREVDLFSREAEPPEAAAEAEPAKKASRGRSKPKRQEKLLRMFADGLSDLTLEQMANLLGGVSTKTVSRDLKELGLQTAHQARQKRPS